jgi:hypothetical protein
MVSFEVVRQMVQEIQSDPNMMLKIVGVTAVVNAIFASFMHRRGTLTIYYDYTDAAMTACIPGSAIVLFLLFYIFQWPDASMVIIPITVGFISLFAMINTWRENKNPLWFLVSLLAKFTVLLIFLFFFFSAGGRRKGESKRSAQRRASRERAAAIAGFTAWSVWVTRSPSFSPIRSWFIR